MLGKEYQQKKRQHIGKDHNQILVTAGHFHNLYNTVAPGTGQTEQETGPQGGKYLPVSEYHRGDSQITIAHINIIGKISGNGIGEADAAKAGKAPETITATRRTFPTSIPAASTA